MLSISQENELEVDSTGLIIVVNAFSLHREQFLSREENISYWCETVNSELLQGESLFFLNVSTLYNEECILYIGERFLWLYRTILFHLFLENFSLGNYEPFV